MDLTSARIASQIDRLVLGINRQVGPRHGRVLSAIAAELGLDSLRLVPHFADFWLAGPLRAELAETRLPYAPPRTVQDRMKLFVELGLVIETAQGLEATDRFRPLLVASIAAREDVVDRTWALLQATEVEQLLDDVVGAISEPHIVAFEHGRLSPAPNRALRLYDRLVTLRYVRQADHVEAWRAAGMTAGEMTVLTPLWLREQTPDRGVGWSELERRGFVEEGRLNARGRRLREQIEADTNRRAESTWSGLGLDDRERLVEMLSQMPDTIAPGS